MTVATRLCEAIARFPFAGGASQPTGRLTVSIGVAELAPSIAFNKDDLLKAADTALYAAKASGRNRVEAARVRVP